MAPESVSSVVDTYSVHDPSSNAKSVHPLAAAVAFFHVSVFFTGVYSDSGTSSVFISVMNVLMTTFPYSPSIVT